MNIRIWKHCYEIEWIMFRNERNVIPFIALAISILFCGFAIKELLGYGNVPEVIKGLRYTATCGLAATMFVFAFFSTKVQIRKK